MNAQMKEASPAATSEASQEEQRQPLNSLAILEESQASSKGAPSVFTEFAWKYIERDISVVPIAPNSKKPGQWSQDHGWRGMSDWTRFADRLPNDENEIPIWSDWPNAGIGVVLGKTSRIVALDKDYDLPEGGDDALNAIIPYSPVAKKGQKGWTKFYRYNGEPSRAFDAGGHRVLDVLSDGRQTVVPPTAHPSGCNYVWLTEETLDNILSVDELPQLPDDFMEQVERVLAPYQTDQDRQHQKKPRAPKDAEEAIGSRTAAGQYYAELNAKALANLDLWVPKLVPHSRRHGDGYRTIATWRGCENPNVGIVPEGIKDWGGGYGLTPIDLVMHANGMQFPQAAESLGNCLPRLAEDDDWLKGFTVNGQAIGAPAPAGAPPQPPVVLPWLQPKAPKSIAAPAPLILPPSTSFEPAPAVPNYIANAPGILGDVARWITATAPKSQPELSLAAAIALCSVVMGRCYKSNKGNFTSLFLIMVAKSTEGKEHPQACVEKVLTAAGLPQLIGGSGYTSPGAVFTALVKSPAHIATIDEMGKLLKSSRAKGNAHGEAAIDKLVECFGRQDGILRPPTYSSMSDLAKGSASDKAIVHNPAITLLGATTPATFYENLTADLVKDGFLGRCIVVESTQPRQETSFADQTDPPAHVIEWVKKVHKSQAIQGDLASLDSPGEPATTILLPFSDECMDRLKEFDRELTAEKSAAEGEGLDVLLGRTLEKSMKLAMIVCKAENPANKLVLPHHLEWAINYVREYDYKLVKGVKDGVSENDFDKESKKILKCVRNVRAYKPSGQGHLMPHMQAGMMPHTVLLKLSHMKAKPFQELIDTLVETKQLQKIVGELLGDGMAVPGALYKMPAE